MFSYSPNSVTSAMGDAGVALISEDITSAVLNPASTIGAYRSIGSINNSLLFNTIQYNFLGAQIPPSIGNFGITCMYAGFGKIDYFDNLGNSINMGTSNDQGLVLNYSIDLMEKIPTEFMYGGFGVNLKVLKPTLADYSAEAFAADVGGIFRFSGFDNLSLALAYKNLATSMKFIRESNELPKVLTVGAAYTESDFFNLKAAADYNIQIYSGNFFLCWNFFLADIFFRFKSRRKTC
jgi:hypothetical protein